MLPSLTAFIADFGLACDQNRRDGGTVATSWTPAPLVLLGRRVFLFFTGKGRAEGAPTLPSLSFMRGDGARKRSAVRRVCHFLRSSSHHPMIVSSLTQPDEKHPRKRDNRYHSDETYREMPGIDTADHQFLCVRSHKTQEDSEK
jgi:hypothetical protein